MRKKKRFLPHSTPKDFSCILDAKISRVCPARDPPVRTVDVSAEERRRIWRVLDRSAFSFSSLPLSRGAVEWRPKTVGRYGFRSPTRQSSQGSLLLSLLFSHRPASLWKSSRFRCIDRSLEMVSLGATARYRSGARWGLIFAYLYVRRTRRTSPGKVWDLSNSGEQIYLVTRECR